MQRHVERRTDPLALFAEWYAEAEAREPALPEAAGLATVGADGRPSSRMVLAKRFSEQGFDFFTSSTSRKGHELAANPYGALTWHWKSLQRQVRVEGRVDALPDEESDAYWATRPRGSQISARASAQSEPIASRADLEVRVAEIDARFKGQPVPRPAFWRGYRLVPNRIEFWQHRDDRLHDRLEFRREGPRRQWVATLLQP